MESDAGQEIQKSEQVELEEISEDDVLKRTQGNPDNTLIQPEVIPEARLRRSSRLSKPPE